MKLVPHIEVVGIANTAPVREATLRHARALEQFDEHIVDCRMTVGLWNKHQDAGRLFRVQVEVDLAHTALHLARETESEPNDEDMDAVLHGAIESVCHQIDVALAQRDNKPVSKLSPEERRLRPLHGRVE